MRRIPLIAAFLLLMGFIANAQTAGQVMFVGFNTDGNDGFSFVTLVDLPAATAIRFNDNEYGGTNFDNDTDGGTTDGSLTWTNNTGNTIFAGTVITINNSATTRNASIGTTSGGTIDLRDQDEVLYMFIGTNASSPTTFLSAIANNGFSVANGSLTNTGLTVGTNAISFTGSTDLMVYTASVDCPTTISNAATAIATTSNWTTQNTAANDATNGYPDFPGDVPCNFYGLAFGQVTYYSRNATSGGQWNSNTAWTTNSTGAGAALATGVWPRRQDNVVILSGHTIVVDAIDDNKSCGVSPDDLNLANVGPGFTGFSVDMFYHTGNITISGTLNVTGGSNDVMIAGFTRVLSGGTFSLASSLVNLGYLDVSSGSTLSMLDDFQLSGSSNTVINTSSIITDNLGIDFTDATLCGSGAANLQSGGGSAIVYTNGATVSQICNTFTINCVGGGCTGFPVMGSGSNAGNTGPGGVGKTNATSALVLWLNPALTGAITTSGTSVTAWNDRSGFNNHALPPAAANQPTLNTNALNSQSTITFDGTNHYLSVADAASIDLTQWSFFMVSRANLHKNYNAFFVKGNDGSENYEFLSNFPSAGDIHNPVLWTTGVRTTDSETALGSMSNTTFGIFQYDYDNVNLGMYKNLSQIFTRAETRTPQTNALPLFVGNEANVGGRNLNGSMAELFAFNSKVNTAQQIIINNYLSAKFNIALSANDIYTMDNSLNGDFDFNVAGIGYASDGSIHRDAKGPGIVRMISQNSLSFTTGEFLLWGHNSGALTSNLVDVDNTIIKERFNRVWRISEVGDVGEVTISFDMTGLGTPLAANLRLLVDRNGNGFADNDVTPISGATFAGSIVTFSGVNLIDGDRFTLGNTSLTNPLPIELDMFKVEAMGNQAKILWSTASELNNDFFTIERSQTGTTWNQLATVNGAGTTSKRTNYSMIDDGPYPGVSYYRIKQTDFDGTTSYSPIRSLTMDSNSLDFVVYPNPSTGNFTVTGSLVTPLSKVSLMDSQGRQVMIKTSASDFNSISIHSESLPSGIYILQISNGRIIKSVKVIKR